MPMTKSRDAIDWSDAWPALPLADWKDTYATLHMWTQVVGKVRLARSPHVNHWWEVPLYVSARGLTTSPIPYDKGVFEVQFDFIGHKLEIVTSTGEIRDVRLTSRTVADFYGEVMEVLRSLDINATIWTMPVEVPDPIKFDEDRTHTSYDPDYAHRFWRILVAVDTVFKEFRSRFLGKVSPVHFFWGSFDLCVTRFSGRRAPDRPGADRVTREAYSHEVISVGFWPGGAEMNGPAFYAYASPEPPGFKQTVVHPAQAFYSTQMNEFLLRYDDVRLSESPGEMLLDFCESTYEAGATVGNWDRENLEAQYRGRSQATNS